MKPYEEVFSLEEIRAITDLKERAKDFMWKKVPASVSQHGILSGGCFASWYHKEPVKDFDIFFLDTPVIQDWKDDVMMGFQTIRKLPSKGEYAFSDSSIIDVYNYSHFNAEADCQFIFTKYKTRQELLASFDYEHAKLSFCGSASDKDQGILYVTKEAIESIRAKTLVRTKSPHTSAKRLEKFLSRGWKQKQESNAAKAEDIINEYFDKINKLNAIYEDEQTKEAVKNWLPIGSPLSPSNKNNTYDIETIIDSILGEENKQIIGAPKKEEEDNKYWHKKLMEKLKRPWDF